MSQVFRLYLSDPDPSLLVGKDVAYPDDVEMTATFCGLVLKLPNGAEGFSAPDAKNDAISVGAVSLNRKGLPIAVGTD